MSYTGLWRRTRTLSANPNLGGVVDPRHGDPVDYGPAPQKTPASAPAAAPSLFAADDWMLPPTTIDPGIAPGITREPVDRHDVGTVMRGGTRLADGTNVEATAARSIDLGAAAAARAAFPIHRADRDVYRTDRLEATRSVAGSRAALTRGRNSLPENNPDGPPDQGHYITRWIDRRLSRRPYRPDLGPLWAYRAALATQTRPPTDANVYTSPWATLQAARKRRIETPMVRRTPRPYGEDATTDGTDVVQPPAGSEFWSW